MFLLPIRGTVDPNLVYVVSSHYDSVPVVPGADDDSSGTAALLETARVLAGRVRYRRRSCSRRSPARKAGLLGSREFVRRAVSQTANRRRAQQRHDRLGQRSAPRQHDPLLNPGIRDIQHGAAILFTNLITYDALYYKSTDAAAFYDAYGDIVGGIGSYPVLASALPPVTRHRHDQPRARDRNRQDDGGHADAPGMASG